VVREDTVRFFTLLLDRTADEVGDMRVWQDVDVRGACR
jgi:hypothetical protein